MINIEYLVEYEWQFFIDHIAKYYSIPAVLLIKYEDEFRWWCIDKNDQIIWKRGLIEKYKERFQWSNFIRNSNYHWEIDDIKRFKGFLNAHMIGNSKYFKVTEEILNRPPTKGFRVVDNNIYFTEELQNQFPEMVSTYYKVRGIDDSDNEELFQFIKNEMTDDLLRSILENKIDNKQKYFHISLNEYIYTDYPLSYRLAPSHARFDYESNKIELEDLFINKGERVKIDGNIIDGKKKVPELIKVNGIMDLYLVSEHLRTILEQFGDFIFFNLDVSHKNLIVDSSFSAVSFASNFIERIVDYNKTRFEIREAKENIEKGYTDIIEVSFDSKEEFWNNRRLLREDNKSIRFLNYPISKPIDVFLKSDLIISEFLKDAIEQLFPNHFRFVSARALNITIPEADYQKKIEKHLNVNWDALGIGHTSSKPDKELVFFKRKQKRLKKAKVIIPKNKFSIDGYRDIEIALNIIIPKEVKQRIGVGFPEGYEILPIEKFYLQNEYSINLPRTFNSLIVAENGVGDGVGFILSKESDFSYDSKLIEFMHETGEIKYIDE